MAEPTDSSKRKPDGSSAAQDSGVPDRELSERLRRLNAALDKAQAKDQSQPARSQRDTSASSGMALAFRLGAEFVSGVLVGALLGWGLDAVLGIAPWGMIVLTLIGFGAGVVNMMRAAGETGSRKRPGA